MFSKKYASWGKLAYGDLCRKFSMFAKSKMNWFNRHYPAEYLPDIWEDTVRERIMLTEFDFCRNRYLDTMEHYLESHENMIAAMVGEAFIVSKDSIGDLSDRQKAKYLDAICKYADKLTNIYQPQGKFITGGGSLQWFSPFWVFSYNFDFRILILFNVSQFVVLQFWIICTYKIVKFAAEQCLTFGEITDMSKFITKMLQRQRLQQCFFRFFIF